MESHKSPQNLIAKYDNEWYKKWSSNPPMIMERELNGILKKELPKSLYIDTQYLGAILDIVKGHSYFVGVIMLYFLNSVNFRLISYDEIPKVGVWRKFRQAINYNSEHQCYNMMSRYHDDINYAKNLPWVWFHYNAPLNDRFGVDCRLVRIWNRSLEGHLASDMILTLELRDEYVSPRDLEEGRDIDSPRYKSFYTARVQTHDTLIYEEIINRDMAVKLCHMIFCASNDVKI